MRSQPAIERFQSLGGFSLVGGVQPAGSYLSLPEHIVRDEHPARAEPGNNLLEVGRILLLHSIDIGEIERAAERWQRNESLGLDYLYLVFYTGSANEFSGHSDAFKAGIDGCHPSIRGHRPGERNRAIADGCPDFKRSPRAYSSHGEIQKERDLRVRAGHALPG